MRDNPYYLGNQENPPTQFVFETEKQIFSQELPWDVKPQDLCHAFYTACTSMYDSELVLKTMYAFGNKELLKDSVWQCKSFLVELPCTLTVRTGNSTTSVKLKEQATGIDLCRVFYTLCLGMTYFSENIYETMKEYAEEMLPTEENKEEV